jgi:hypothetical protein
VSTGEGSDRPAKYRCDTPALMGTFLRWILIRTGSVQTDGLPDGLNDVAIHTFGTFGGWFVADLQRPSGTRRKQGPQPLPWTFQDLEGLIVGMSDGRPALAVSVADSDYAYIVGASEGLSFPVVTDIGSAEGDADGAAAVHRCRELFNDDPLDGAARALAEWSQHARSPADADEIASILYRDEVVAESKVVALLRRLGLPTAPDAHPRYLEAIYVRDHGAGSDLGRSVTNVEAAFVTGQGIDFHGVWKKEGGPPLKRFSGPLADVRARYARLGLLFPPAARYQGAIVVAADRMVWSRFLMGVGEDAYGIWRRRHRGPAIETFPLTNEGMDEMRRRFWELNGPIWRWMLGLPGKWM